MFVEKSKNYPERQIIVLTKKDTNIPAIIRLAEEHPTTIDRREGKTFYLVRFVDKPFLGEIDVTERLLKKEIILNQLDDLKKLVEDAFD